MSDKPTTLPPGTPTVAETLARLLAETLAARVARAVSESADSRRLEEDGPVCACCTAPVRVQDFLCAECKASPM